MGSPVHSQSADLAAGLEAPQPGTGQESLVWTGLLSRFYARSGRPLPHLVPVKGAKVPEPYHRLLVHSRDMTPTLEAFCGSPMRILVLSRETEANAYLREVVLEPTGGPRPVEYGVIRIYLDVLPPVARRRVLEEEKPLGGILQAEAIPHLSWPQSFFKVDSDAHLEKVLRLERPATLYGRRNLLLDGSRHLLAEVMEILGSLEDKREP